jgi:3-deoxy-D-manno-octulosonic-acid transferase
MGIPCLRQHPVYNRFRTDMRFIIDLAYLFAGLLFSPVVLYRRFRHDRYRRGWAQRFGEVYLAARR